MKIPSPGIKSTCMHSAIGARGFRRSCWRFTNLLLVAASSCSHPSPLFLLAMSCCPPRHGALSTSHNVGTKTAASSSTNANPSNAPTKKKGVPPRSLYRRPLPDSCVALSSEEGQKRFASALASGGLKSFFPLIEQFTTQSEPAYCGISTLVIVLNALAVDPRRSWKGPWRWYEESMLNCGLDMEEVKSTGITINEFRCLATCQGLAVAVVRADEDEDADAGLQKFRRAVRKACVKPDNNNDDNNSSCDELLVASYSRKVLGQTGSGHFSPIAAYDSESDSVLVLDTARFKYGAHWVALPLLFDSMKPIDPDTNRSRGYALLCEYDQGNEQHPSSSLIPSLLFRSQRKQNPVRKEYKEFLAATARAGDGELSFDRVAAFWAQKDPKHVWKMMEPQFSPLEGEESSKALIASVRGLIKRMLSKIEHDPLPPECCSCRVNFARTLDMSLKEAIFVIYLASLDEEKRKEIIFRPENAAAEQEGAGAKPTPEQTQLLAEAELVRYAIDVSDGLDCQ